MLGIIFIVGFAMWMVQANRSYARQSVDALGANPDVVETRIYRDPPGVLAPKLLYGGDRKHYLDPISTPDAVIYRRNPDLGGYGYAFLLRLRETPTGGTELSISGAPLNKSQKKIPKSHWAKFRNLIDETLGPA